MKEKATLLPAAEEYVILSTCNRFEAYFGTEKPCELRRELELLLRSIVPYERGEAPVYFLEGRQSISQLFRVVCGMDSLIVGEDQIQNQVKEAYLHAQEAGTVGPRLGRLFEKALSVGKRVRTETGLCNGAVSVGSAAVQLAEERLGDLRDVGVTILGAGEMATSIARSLVGKGPRTIFVSSRTYENARLLAHQLDGKAVGLESLSSAMRESDVVLVATAAPHAILGPELAREALAEGRGPLLIVDISMPSNVDPAVASIPGVQLVNMEGLKGVAMRNMTARRLEMVEAQRIVDEEIRRWTEETMEAHAEDVISGLNHKLISIRNQELDRALRMVENGTDPRPIIEDFSRVLISRILADPISKLKEACRSGETDVCRFAEYLFDLEAD